MSAPERPARLPKEGELLAGRYLLGRLLGAGGSGFVHEAFDRVLRTRVAVKMLRADRVDEAALARLRREVRAARRVETGRVVRIFDIDRDGEVPFITMELVEGESLAARLTRPMPPREAVAVAIQVAEGLEALHAAGVVHRDVKPGNVLFTKEGSAKLVDLGLARIAEPGETKLTAMDTFVGTAEYLAPEQALGAPLDARTDLYALGVVLFEMLSGRPPWNGLSSIGVVVARFESRAPDVRELSPGTPRWLADVVRRLLERRPEDRYSSASELLGDLRRQSLGWRALLPRPRRRAAVGAALGAAAALSGLLAVGWNAGRFDRLVSDGAGGTQALDRRGRVLWKRSDLAFPARAVAARLAKGSEPVVAAVVGPVSALDPNAQHTLALLDARTGASLRNVTLPEGRPLSTSRLFVAHHLDAVDLEGNGVDQVFVFFRHVAGPASYLVAWDPVSNRSRVVFAGNGHHGFGLAADVDGDGRKEIVLHGIINAFGHHNAVAILRAFERETGRPLTSESAVTPDVLAAGSEAAYLDYVLLPRGSWTAEGNGGLSLGSDGRTLTVPFVSGRRVTVDLAGCGLVAGRAKADCVALREARHRAWVALREASQMAELSRFDRARDLLADALAGARAAEDPLQEEVVRMRMGVTEIGAGRTAEAEPELEALCARSESCSEMADAIGRAAHLAGELPAAVRWYARSMETTGETGHLYSAAWTVDLGMLALGEMERWEEAAAFGERYAGIVPDWRQTHLPWWRWFVAWRRGEPAPADLPPPAVPDLRRYWWLEWRAQRGDDPAELLAELGREAERASGPTCLLGSLRAELLSRQGRLSEALAAAEKAWGEARDARRRKLAVRGHLALVAERYARLLERSGRATAAGEVRREAHRISLERPRLRTP